MTARTRARATSEDGAVTPASIRRARGRMRQVVLSMLVIASFGALAVGLTMAGFSDTAISSGNQFQSGTVDIDDNDNGVAILNLTNAGPGGWDEGCITLTSRGTLASSVRIYGTTTGTGLDAYATLTITRGTYSSGSPSFDDCTNFQADGVQYVGGQANGVIYNGTLQAFPDDYDAGLNDPYAASPESWTEGESHVYKIRVDIQDNDAAEGLDATQAIIWEARNT